MEPTTLVGMTQNRCYHAALLIHSFIHSFKPFRSIPFIHLILFVPFHSIHSLPTNLLTTRKLCVDAIPGELA